MAEQQDTGVMPAISVIVVNYQSGPHLRSCLDALARQSFRDFEVVLVDNGSTDGSLAAVDAFPGDLRLIAAGRNIGFAAANNLAARAARGKWLACLNPDAFADRDWLAELWAATGRYPDAAMFGSLQRQADDPRRLDGAGDVYHAVGVAWRGGYGRPVDEAPEDGEVFAPCAAAALYRRDAFLSVGGFDERFFCYFEDVDLAFRLRLAGERCVQVRRAVVDHVGSASLGRQSAFAVRHGARNRVWTFLRDMPGPLLWPLLLPFCFATIALLLKAAAGGKGGAALRGVGEALQGAAPLLASRREVQRRRAVSCRTLARALTWRPGALLDRRADVRRPVAPRAETARRSDGALDRRAL